MRRLHIRRRVCTALAALVAGVAAVAEGGQGNLAGSVDIRCPAVLGIGVETDLIFCDVLAQQDPTLGITVDLPPRTGEAMLSFNLHNRHTYSEDDVRRGRAYVRYLAEVAVASPLGDVLARRYVLNEFRTAEDLFDRVGGGAGPDGLKAVAPTGVERVFVTIPADLEQVVVVGQTLELTGIDGNLERIWSPGRPVAIISDMKLEYLSP